MSRSTGPLLAAGAVTMSNQLLLSDTKKTADEMWTTAVAVGVSTGILIAVFSAMEKIAEPLAVAFAYTALLTTLVVRFNNQPTPLERILKLV